MAKLKLAIYWSASCGGCDVAILDTNEKILQVAEIADIVFWPIALDFKRHHVEAMPDKNIDICLFNGAVRTSEQEEIAKLLRAKSKTMVAFGSCAHLGGIPGLSNFSNRAQAFERAYVESQSCDNPDKVFPQTVTNVAEGELELPEWWDTVKALNQLVDVEYYIPGCPPTVPIISQLVDALAAGNLPPVGTVFGSDKALCEECPRTKEEKTIDKIYRPHEIIPDPEKCLLEQGIICIGPATRGGCEARCIKANMPCRGCFGPPPGVTDQGAKMVSAIASILGLEDEKDLSAEYVERLMNQVKDPAGTFYRFGLPTAMINRKRI